MKIINYYQLVITQFLDLYNGLEIQNSLEKVLHFFLNYFGFSRFFSEFLEIILTFLWNRGQFQIKLQKKFRDIFFAEACIGNFYSQFQGQLGLMTNFGHHVLKDIRYEKICLKFNLLSGGKISLNFLWNFITICLRFQEGRVIEENSEK